MERGWYGDRNTDSASFAGDCICWNCLGIQVLLGQERYKTWCGLRDFLMRLVQTPPISGKQKCKHSPFMVTLLKRLLLRVCKVELPRAIAF